MRMSRGTTMLAGLVVLGVMVGVPGALAAQEPQVGEPQAVELTDELLERFVGVYPAVVNLVQDAQTQIATAADEEAAQAVQVDVQRRIQEVLFEGEVSVEEYEAVVHALNEDDELRARVEEMLIEEEAEQEAAEDWIDDQADAEEEGVIDTEQIIEDEDVEQPDLG
jgi:hypothetical protein